MEGGTPQLSPAAPQGESGIQLNPNYVSQYNPLSGLGPMAMLQQYRSNISKGVGPAAMMQQYQQRTPSQFAAPLSITKPAYPANTQPYAFPAAQIPAPQPYAVAPPPAPAPLPEGYTYDAYGQPIYNSYG